MIRFLNFIINKSCSTETSVVYIKSSQNARIVVTLLMINQMHNSKTVVTINAEGLPEIDSWLHNFSAFYNTNEASIIRQACALARLTGSDSATSNAQSCLQQGIYIAEILKELEVDEEAIAAGILYSSVRYADLNLEDVSEQVSPIVAKLISGVSKMESMQGLQTQTKHRPSHQAIDNLRKMLLAIVDDVRIVLIKLAERLAVLRHLSHLPEAEKHQEARITMEIYAPLANRLGIGHLKWELEDLSFRYLEPQTYLTISKALKSTRREREVYVKKMIHLLEKTATELGIERVEVTGRAKHIYSIYRKMTRKNVNLDEIYDAIAFRILLPTVQDCYGVLGHIHSLWKPIPKEFDDYITQPKPNGYRSVHTAVYGPDNHPIEIQMRTFEMHHEAELGVAAHWAYKEGRTKLTGYEAKIAWLRQVMEWQKEVSDEPTEKMLSQAFEDRIYVFTPQGDVLELQQGATSLDFAYQIHSALGHRCRGAKVNGQIVPLTYALKTGECVELLTAKEGHPSRDWLNPHLGYLKTSRAKAKVLQWFRQQDAEQNQIEGHNAWDKEVRRLGLKHIDLNVLAHKFNFTRPEELFVAIGRGDVALASVTHFAQELIAPSKEPEPFLPSWNKPTEQSNAEIEIQGVGNLLTHIANCCKPIPGDAVIGYVTVGHGVSVHRQDCSNILHVNETHKERLIQVSWGSQTQNQYIVDLVIRAYDRHGLIRDITQFLLNERISVVGLTCSTDKKDHTAQINVSIEIHGLNPLGRVLAKLLQIENVIEARRV